MRFIYMDEAGTSDDEPVTVVVGVIVNADTQWIPTALQIEKTLLTVPEHYRKDFIFHATEIWNSKKYRTDWSREDRTKFLNEMMSIPLNTGLAIAYVVVRRSGPCLVAGEIGGLSKVQLDHMAAFGLCVGMADFYIRERGYRQEIATIVAEDVHNMRTQLHGMVSALRSRSFVLPKDTFVNFSRNGPELFLNNDRQIRVTRVVDTVHFADKRKKQAFMLQLADACAFGLRRYFNEKATGIEFATSIHGGAENASKLQLDNPNKDLTLGLLFAEQPKPTFSLSYSFGKRPS